MRNITRQCAALTLAAAVAVPAVAETGLYAGAGAGFWGSDVSGFDDSAPAVRGLIGYRFNEYLALQADLNYGTELSDGGIDVEAWGFEAALRPSFPIGTSFEAYGRLGWGHYEYDASGFGINVDGSEDEFVWAVGGAYRTSSPWSFFAEYSEPNDTDSYYFTVGATYQFQN